MVEIEVGDVVLIRGAGGRYHAVVSGARLGRLVVERCDGRPSAPVALRDVLTVFKEAGAPGSVERPERVRPTAQLKLDLE
jgi:hypothetical protein